MNRKIITLITILFLIGSNIYGQKTEVINFEKVYNFINSTISNDTTKFNLSDRTSFGMFGDDTTSILTDSLFDKVDRDYFREQFAMLGKVKWQTGKIIGANIIPQQNISKVFKKKNGWNKFRKKYGNCLTSFSLPIFSKDYDYCIIYHWTQCDYLAGGGSTDLYKLENGKWIFIKSYMIGIS
jgi:hypothetical protein